MKNPYIIHNPRLAKAWQYGYDNRAKRADGMSTLESQVCGEGRLAALGEPKEIPGMAGEVNTHLFPDAGRPYPLPGGYSVTAAGMKGAKQA